MDVDSILKPFLIIWVGIMVFIAFIYPAMVAISNYCRKRHLLGFAAFLFYMLFNFTGAFVYYLGITGNGSFLVNMMFIVLALIFLGAAINHVDEID